MPVLSDERFQAPSDENARIWRYMDFTKLVSMLDRGSLFFARLDQLGDPFEGSFLPAPVFREGGHVTIANADEAKHMLRSTASGVHVNCWHANPGESAALWQLYLKSNEGVAVQSTFRRLREALGDSPYNVYVGLICYLDYEHESFEGWPLDLFRACMSKRKCFEHERELRALAWPVPDSESGVYLKVELSKLVEAIYVGPASPSWLTELVDSVCKRYGLETPVVRSRLLEAPPY